MRLYQDDTNVVLRAWFAVDDERRIQRVYATDPALIRDRPRPSDPRPVTPYRNNLAFTGTDNRRWVVIGSVFVLIGAMVLIGRRRALDS